MKFTPPDTCLEDYEKRRGAFLKDLIAFTPNVSVRAKEFRQWIDENSRYFGPSFLSSSPTWPATQSGLHRYLPERFPGQAFRVLPCRRPAD